MKKKKRGSQFREAHNSESVGGTGSAPGEVWWEMVFQEHKRRQKQGSTRTTSVTSNGHYLITTPWRPNFQHVNFRVCLDHAQSLRGRHLLWVSGYKWNTPPHLLSWVQNNVLIHCEHLAPALGSHPESRFLPRS